MMRPLISDEIPEPFRGVAFLEELLFARDGVFLAGIDLASREVWGNTRGTAEDLAVRGGAGAGGLCEDLSAGGACHKIRW